MLLLPKSSGFTIAIGIEMEDAVSCMWSMVHSSQQYLVVRRKRKMESR